MSSTRSFFLEADEFGAAAASLVSRPDDASEERIVVRMGAIVSVRR